MVLKMFSNIWDALLHCCAVAWRAAVPEACRRADQWCNNNSETRQALACYNKHVLPVQNVLLLSAQGVSASAALLPTARRLLRSAPLLRPHPPLKPTTPPAPALAVASVAARSPSQPQTLKPSPQQSAPPPHGGRQTATSTAPPTPAAAQPPAAAEAQRQMIPPPAPPPPPSHIMHQSPASNSSAPLSAHLEAFPCALCGWC